jgi:hypothetical protein
VTHRVTKEVLRDTSKPNSRPQLKRPRAAGAEDLPCPAGRLPERDVVGEIAAVVGKVRGIVDVECFADEPVPEAS